MTDEASPTRQQRYRERKVRRKARQARYWQRHKDRLTRTRRKDAFVGYDGLVDALVRRRKQLCLTVEALDELAGFPKGYATKLENYTGPQGRVAGAVTLPLWLQALGLGFIAVPMVDGSTKEQAHALARVKRPPQNGADLQRRPRR